jgi:hypothetical protein|tara:strand:- start:318 stop:629 length:312 start_codon:yes stop_codon:yes gene_type:complete
MQKIYDSDTFSVTHILANVSDDAHNTMVLSTLASSPQQSLVMARHGFEILDKLAGKEIYLDGSWAEFFQQHVSNWQQRHPSQEEIEDTLAQYTQLAQNSLSIH